MQISIIVAIAKNNVIGENNKMPWYLPADLKYFKEKTTGHHVIMGRKTFESISNGKPLPNRTSIIITRQKDYKADNCIVVHSLQEAIDAVKNDHEAFIIGGTQIYTQALKLVDKLYITKINEEFEGDTFFPEINSLEWGKIEQQDFSPNERNKYSYSFQVFIRQG